MTDEIDELINNVCMHSVVKDGVQTIVYEGLSPKDLKAKLLALKKKWEIDILKRVASVHCGIPTKTLKRADLKDWIVYEIDQLTNGDKR